MDVMQKVMYTIMYAMSKHMQHFMYDYVSTWLANTPWYANGSNDAHDVGNVHVHARYHHTTAYA